MNDNREIKFRVWKRLTVEDEKYTLMDSPTISNIALMYSTLNDIFLNPLLVFQQYTGFKDNSGKEIYEGDILLCSYRRERRYIEVRFHNGSFLFETRLPMEFLQYNEVEVAGNIFENSELLERIEIIDTFVKPQESDEPDDLDLKSCEQCGENAWDGYICHSCGMKRI